MSQSPSSAHAISLQQTLNGVEANISSFGTGPFSPEQVEKLNELTKLKQRLVEQIRGAAPPVQPVAFTQAVQQTTQRTMNSRSPAPAGAVMQTMVGVNSIKTEVPTISLPQGASSGSIHQPLVDDDKILNKRRLQELVKEIDPSEQLDDDVEEMLMQVTDDFIESVVGAACDLAKHRNGSVLEVKDLKLHLENHWNISIPGYGSNEIKPFKKATTTEAHKQRLSLIRKATKK